MLVRVHRTPSPPPNAGESARVSSPRNAECAAATPTLGKEGEEEEEEEEEEETVTNSSYVRCVTVDPLFLNTAVEYFTFLNHSAFLALHNLNCIIHCLVMICIEFSITL